MYRRFKLTSPGSYTATQALTIMSTPLPGEPKIVSYNIPRIEVYQVADDELNRIEEAATNVGNEFATMLASISIMFSLLIALTQGTFETEVDILIKAAVAVSALVSLYMGIKWGRHRSSVSRILSHIRSRRTEPDT